MVHRMSCYGLFAAVATVMCFGCAGSAGAQDASAPTPGAKATKKLRTQAEARRTPPTDQNVAERYEGRLTSSDIGFNLKLYHDGTARATWTPAVGTDARYSGAYTGTDGNYSVKLTRDDAAADNSGSPPALDLTMHSTGGMVSARYKQGGVAWRDASSLRLMEVDAGDVKLNGKHANSSSSSGGAASSRNRGSGVRRNRGSSRANQAARSAFGRLLRKR